MNVVINSFEKTDATIKLAQSEFEKLSSSNLKAVFELSENAGYSLKHEDGILIHHELMFDEIDFYNQNNVEGLLTQFHLPHWGVYSINYYAMAQAGYAADKQQFLTKTFNSLFGEHAEQYHEFYKLISTGKTST